MQISRERIAELKALIEKEKGTEITWEEATDSAYRLVGLAEIAYDQWIEDTRRQKKLKESPKGFVLEGVGYTCFICGNSTREGENWYDKWGIKCSVCQKSVDRKEIPPSLAKRKESWYSTYDLESRFNINRHVLKRFMKAGILRARIVTNEHGKPHVHLFLIKDNRDVLPPKKLTESQMVKETKDGQDWYHLEPWYKLVKDPHVHLKGYKIMNHLRIVTKNE